MRCSPKMEAVRKLKAAAKKLIAAGHGDDMEAGEELMASSKAGKLTEVENEAEEELDDDIVEAGEEEPEEELTDLEEEALQFLGKGGKESPLAAGQTRVVFQVESPRKMMKGRGKA